MNGIQNKKGRTLQKPVPGCLGRMVNLFDSSNGVPKNGLLTYNPHHNDAARNSSPSRDQCHDTMVSELKRDSSNGKMNGGTPMKLLIAQEISKGESRCTSPSLVARLMGLEDLPQRQPVLNTQGIHSKSSSRGSKIQGELFEKRKPYEHSQCHGQGEFKDVYEIQNNSGKTKPVNDSLPPQKPSTFENTNEKRMALIRQKFVEAKKLSTDEKLRQSKEFQDALELLNSNRDLFIKFLQEPNSLFSQNLPEAWSSPPPQTRQITVLRPSKNVGNRDNVACSVINTNDKKKSTRWSGEVKGRDMDVNNSPPVISGQISDDNPSKMTRIVVLKPSTGKSHDIKPLSSPSFSSVQGDLCGKVEDDVPEESKESAMEITHNMAENLSDCQRDESLILGYTGDISSFNKSENEFEVENLSDPEFMSPGSRHSWDHITRFESPYCSSSYSQPYYSPPESSVCREAKKRLSERWAKVAANRNFEEQRCEIRSCNTLGEMLSLREMKRFAFSDEVRCKVQDSDIANESPKVFQRSKSVPESSAVYADSGKTNCSKDFKGKSPLKEKVSSLFFSRNKKVNKEKPCKSQSMDISNCDIDGFLAPPPTKFSTETSPSDIQNDFEENLPSSDLIGNDPRHGIVPQESLAAKCEKNHNQDQPSPISVLLPLFEEDDSTTPESSCSTKQEQSVMQVPAKAGKRAFISWDNYAATPRILKQHFASPTTDQERHEWLILVQTLLSAAGLLDGPASCNSVQNPLGLSLREKFVGLGNPGLTQEAPKRQWRSNLMLAFDCIDITVAEITKGEVNDRCELANEVVSRMGVKWSTMRGGVDEIRVLRKEVVDLKWVDSNNNNNNNIVGYEIWGMLVEELLEELVIELCSNL